MQKKYVFRNSLLITGLVASVIILSAQVNPPGPTRENQVTTDQEKIIRDTLPAPDNKEGLAELDKIIERYRDGNLYLAGEIQLYEDASVLTHPQEKTSFITANGPGGSYYEIDSVITVMNTDLTVLVDKREKSIAIQENESEKVTGQSPLPAINQELDAFKSYIYSITVSATGESYKKLVIVFKEDAPVSAQNYEIIYDVHTYQIKKIAFELAEGEITDSNENVTIDADNELVYVDEQNTEISTGYYADVHISRYEIIYKVEKKGDNALTDISRYVNRTTAGYEPAGAFTHFDLLN